MIARIVLFHTFIFALFLSVQSQTITYYQTGEEFSGPFPSWKNVKTVFGATGNGTTDDAAAINRALNAMRTCWATDSTWNVLYFPAGTYLINSSLHNDGRTGGSDYTGTRIVGEDPATTVIKCGATMGTQGSMLVLDGTYTSISRLTFDGQSKATVGLMRDGGYGTDTRVTDMFFKNMGVGVQFGGSGGLGQDLSMIERCRFTSCTNTGLKATNQNVMGLYCMYCVFEDCGAGIENGGGSTHSIGNVYLRSVNYDIGGGFQNYLIFNNTSVGSKIFLAQMTTRNSMNIAMGNKVYNTTGSYSTAPVDVMIDNLFATTHPFMYAGRDNALMVGNTFTTGPGTVPTSYRWFVTQQQIVSASSITVPTTIQLPGIPANNNRSILEIQKNTGDDAAEIQKKILSACSTSVYGTNPVLHFPKGSFRLIRTVVVPRNIPLQFIGDASNCGSSISWSGTSTGPMLKLLGPSRVTFSFLNFSNNLPDAIVIDSADQVGGRIYAEQTNLLGFNGCTNMFVDGVENSDITWLACYLGIESGRSPKLIDVKGGPVLSSGGTTNGQISFLMGYLWGTENTFNLTNGGRLVSGGYRNESPNSDVNFMHLTATSGDYTFVGSDAGSNKFTAPLVLLDGYNKTFCSLAYYVNGIELAASSPTYQIQGSSANCKALVACNGWDGGLNTALPTDKLLNDISSPAGKSTLLNCTGVKGPNSSSLGWFNIPNVTNKVQDAPLDTQLVLDGLKQLRALRIEPPNNRAAGVTDVKFIRGWLQGGQNRVGLTIKAGLPVAVLPQRTQGIHTTIRGTMSQVVVSMGSTISLPDNASSITVYNLQGRLIFNKHLNGSANIAQVIKQIQSINHTGALVVSYSTK